MSIELGNRLQELRKKNGYSQESLAEKLDVSRQAVSKWERGEAAPDTDNLIMLAKLYQVSLDELVDNNVPDTTKTQKVEFKNGDKKISIELPEDDEEDEELDADETLTKQQKNIVKAVNVVTLFGSTIAFFLLGFLLHAWHPAWTLFLLFPVTSTLTEAILARRPNHFAYPVLIVFLYCLFSSLYGLWHILWVLFITIPIYYALCNIFKK